MDNVHKKSVETGLDYDLAIPPIGTALTRPLRIGYSLGAESMS